MTALGHRLDALPQRVRESTRFPLGQYRSLAFGVELHASGAAEVFLEGPPPVTACSPATIAARERCSMLSTG